MEELIITEGEIAMEMYCIIEGIVDLYDLRANRINRLSTGKCFGELGLVGNKAHKRFFTAYCATDVSLALLTKDHFIKICTFYPFFKERVSELMEKQEKLKELEENMKRKYGKQFSANELPPDSNEDTKILSSPNV